MTPLYRITLVVAAACVALRLVAKFSIDGAWDDAHMFGRYADHLLDEHVLSWNPGGPPTYGLTTPLYLLVVLPVRLALRHAQPGLAIVLPSMLSGIALLAAIVLLIRRSSAEQPWVSRAALLAFLVMLAGPGCAFPVHFATGMDTTFDALFLAVYLLVAGGAVTVRRHVVAGCMGGLAFWIRPDLMLYALAVPTVLVFVDPGRRRAAASMFAATAGTLFLVIAVNVSYLHSALPLPFYAKTTGLYGAAFASRYRGAGVGELGHFLATFWPLFALLALDIVRDVRAYWTESSAVEKAVLAATVAHITYYAAFVLPVMGHYQRFYYPTLPALVFLGTNSLVRIGRSTPRHPSAAMAMLAFCWLLIPSSLDASIQDVVSAARDGSLADFNLHRNYRLHHASYWFRLEQAAQLPDDVVVAATEVGYPGTLMPKKQIIDMAGLNDGALIKTKFSGEQFLARFHPDLIYMPHPDYVDMLQSLEDAEQFRSDYELFPPERIHTPLGVAVRRASPTYSRMHDIFDAP